MEENTFSQEPQQETPDQQPSGQLSQDAKNLAMICHLLGALTGFLGPLILWLIKKDDDPYIDSQGKEALNFQITVMIAMMACIPLSFICIGLILMPIIGVADIVLSIMACIAATKGQDYRYPCTLRLIK